MAVVTVNGTKYTVAEGTRLGGLLADKQLIAMPCGGHGRCGKCRITVRGEVSGLSDTESRLLSQDEIEKGIRLACCAAVEGDCTVYLSGEGGVQIQATGDMPDIPLNPAFRAYGFVMDIGTTTLAACLYDVQGRMLAKGSCVNPQNSWGADVISRIEAAMGGADREIAEAIRRAVDGMAAELSGAAGIAPDEIDGMVITGNTVMLHLLTGTSTEPLSHAPFAAERLFGETVSAGELGITGVLPDTGIYLAPCASAFVGADLITALLAGGVCETDSTMLLADIGTNGEMALWHGGALYCCSTAAGPAFEGVGITQGMGGRTGAIDRVWVEKDRMAAHVIGSEAVRENGNRAARENGGAVSGGIGGDIPGETEGDTPGEIGSDAVRGVGGALPQGICGSGIVDATACLLELGLIDETGCMENDAEMILPPVSLTREDIRMVQLAKGAVHAGIRTLLSSAGLECGDVQELLIAGGFGSYLDAENAGRIGLLPAELVSRIRVIGNAALSGAAMLLLNRDYRAFCVGYAGLAEVVELSTHPVFAEEYMERMMF